VARLGKLWYEDRLSLDWKPKTADTMKRILTGVELTGPFWDVG
jgi:hypothetical protein